MDVENKCEHLVAINKDAKPNTGGCEECLKTGDRWVALRTCLGCGHVGCCDSSKSQHARNHFEQTHHPIIQAFGAGDQWKWCYIDSKYL